MFLKKIFKAVENFLKESWEKTSATIISGNWEANNCALCPNNQRRPSYTLIGREENGKMASLPVCVYHKDKFEGEDHWVLGHLRIVHHLDLKNITFKMR